jgi:phosphopantothenoylcysteine decarboxylase/phosphopantothenate--cysteine ligase
MNSRMYENPATQANLQRLEARGVRIVPPGEGALASHGEHGVGRLAEPRDLLAALAGALSVPSWRGLRVLVTAGGTREPIDSVRYIGNRSSGRMGFALASEAVSRGAEVTVIAANVSLPPPVGAQLVEVGTAAELGRECELRFEQTDVLLMAAAVADFRAASPAEHKLKKDAGVPQLELEPTTDVLSTLSARRTPDQVLVGFAAEHGADAVAYGRGKLERKGLDMVVINDVSLPGSGFDAAENEVVVLTNDGIERPVARTSKKIVAGVVLDEVERLRASRKEQRGTVRAGAGSVAGI